MNNGGAHFELEFGSQYHWNLHMSDGVFATQEDTVALPELEAHNDSVQAAVDFYLDSRPSFAIIDKGRTTNERSCIWGEKGHFYGMGYLDNDAVIHNAAQVREYVTPFKSNQYIMQLLFSFAQKYPAKVLLLENNTQLESID